MCWNKEVSLSMFSIGTAFNILACIYIPKAPVIAVSILWEWVLLMQLFDALVWFDNPPKENDKSRDKICSPLRRYSTLGAFAANILQPVILFIVLMFISPSNLYMKIVAAVLCVGYLSYVLGQVANMNRIKCMSQNSDCHLEYNWWNSIEGWTYITTLFSVGLLLLRPWTFCLLEMGYILVTLVVTLIVYRQADAMANMWCWMAAFAPIFTVAFWKISEMYPLKYLDDRF